MIINSKNLFYQLLFAICIITPYLNIYELTFATWLITVLITIRQRYSYTILKYCICFIGILLIAFIVAFFKSFILFNYLRDFTYMVKPVLGFLIGYQLCRSTNINPFKTIIYTGLVLAVGHLALLAYSVLVYRVINIHDLREGAGYFSDFEVYAVLAVLFNKQFQVELTPARKKMLLLVIGTSALLYVSRTNFLQFIILYMGMKGYLKITRRSVTVLGTIAVFTTILYLFLFNMSLTRNGRGIDAFLYKVRNAPVEAFKTKVNKEDYKDFNDNYRSYENIITTRQVSSEGTSAVIFGKGLGSTVDLGREIWSNDGQLIRYLPTLHNGFMTLFLKSGLAGIALNLYFLWLLYRQKKSNDPLVQQINLLLSGTAVFLVLSTWVLLGLYLKIESKSILIGFLLAYKEIIIKNKQLNGV